MKIEVELSGNVVISPDGTEGDSLLLLRHGQIQQITETGGKLVDKKLGRATGFTYGTKTKPAEAKG